MDPFHDNPLENLTGYPDKVTTPSVVRQVKQSIELETLTSQDLHIVAWPWLGSASLGNYTLSGSTTTLGGQVFNVPSVAVYTPAAGVAPVFESSPIGLVFPPSMQRGLGRLVGMGMELVNTTAPINRSGTIYCWRLPGIQSSDETLQYYQGAPLTLNRVGQFRRTATPPSTTAQAMLVPGTRSWASEEGAYIVVPFNADNEPQYPTQTGPLIRTAPIVPLQVSSSNSGDPVLAPNAASISGAFRLIPTNLAGIIATGNNPNSKFTLKVVWYYEEFPDLTSDVLTLATPSCQYDPLALQMYTEVLNSLPVAVPSSWNEAGDWWWDVVTAIKDHAAAVGGLLGGAPGAAIGQAAGSVAGWARDRYMTAPGTGGSTVPTKSVPQKPPRQNGKGKAQGNQAQQKQKQGQRNPQKQKEGAKTKQK